MAVHAHYTLPNAFTSRNGAWDELPNPLLNYGIGFPQPHQQLQQQQFVNGTAFSNPESELTCNFSVSRKRSRPDTTSSIPTSQHQILDQTRLLDSSVTSTSGHSPHAIASQDYAVCLHQQTQEMEELVRLQSEMLLNGLEEARKRHCRSLMAAVEQRVAPRLRDKEVELELAARRNAELEEKVRQMTAETQVWFGIAKNHEAMASSLRTALDHLLLSGAAGTVPGAGAVEEGCGDSADDAASSCYPGDDEEMVNRKGVCRMCWKGGATVILLPCRHLCICQECESKADSCPVCHTGKSASLQISMP